MEFIQGLLQKYRALKYKLWLLLLHIWITFAKTISEVKTRWQNKNMYIIIIMLFNTEFILL